jgi:hypothetical protein
VEQTDKQTDKRFSNFGMITKQRTRLGRTKLIAVNKVAVWPGITDAAVNLNSVGSEQGQGKKRAES